MARQHFKYGILAILGVLVFYHLNNTIWANFARDISKTEFVKSKLVFPASFPLEASELHSFVKETKTLGENGKYKYTSIVQHAPLTESARADAFHPHDFQVYDSSQDIDLDLKRCGSIQKNITAEVSEAIDLPASLCGVVSEIIQGINRGDEYLLELAPYFNMQLRLQVKHLVCHRHWFRLAGSSVYLEQYGYHLLVSRLAYSPDGKRQDPKFSLAYAQLYDKNWREVKDVTLIVPTNEDGAELRVEGQTFKAVHYPQIVPVPIFHNYRFIETKYLGPEDPRLLLAKNEKGHEEPMMVFNLVHQKYEFADDDEDEFLLKKPTPYRSMWVSYPWQAQKGKQNVDDRLTSPHDNSTYSRSVELRIKNLPRQEKQKNWTPMISEVDRAQFGFDKTMLFVYRWASLEILKCDLDTGVCGFVYQHNENLRASSSVGPFRGGTPMANIRHVLQAQNFDTAQLQKLLPPNREIWVGFARAHLVKCGCGNDLYRPNLVVIVKDSIKVDGELKDVYRLSQVSSFASLKMEVVPWDPQKPWKLCSGTNALIPNGISEWRITHHDSDEAANMLDFVDELVLTVSMSDITVNKVSLRGLLKELMKDKSLFLTPATDDTKVNEKKLRIPNESEYKAKSMLGFNNDNLVCAMLASVKFCSDYGKIKLEIERNRVLDTMLLAEDESEARLDAYHDNLDDLGLDNI